MQCHMSHVKLTLLSTAGGCAAKVGPDELQQIVDALQRSNADRESAIQRMEDVGILEIAGGLHMLQSVDIITPVSDDPFVYGAVAVAHALSDIYAKGAKPLCGLFILGFPLFRISVE